MIEVVIGGVGDYYDGSYDISNLVFTNREYHRIKEVSGVRGGDLFDALDEGDTAAFVGLAIVVLERERKIVDPNDLWDAASGAIRIQISKDTDAAPLPDASGSESVETPETSGGSSENDGE